MLLTLGEAKESGLREVAATCPDSQEFVDQVNKATSMLMKRGNWFGTLHKITFCSYNNCLVFPRQVGTLLATNRCNLSVPPQNQWFSFNDILSDDVVRWNTFFNGPGPCANGFVTEDQGTTPVFNQIPCLNDRYVQFYPSRLADIGKKITIFGIDGNGLVIRTTHSDGIFQDGVELVLETPYVQSPFLIRRIDRVLKEVTEGPIYGYQFDGAHQFNLAWYEPTEKSPAYRFVKLKTGVIGGCNCNSAFCGCGPVPFTALVKLQYIPVVNDDDLVLIDDLDALELAIQSVRLSRAFDSQAAETMMSRAVHELNLRLRDKLPTNSIPTRVYTQGSAHFVNQGVGYIH